MITESRFHILASKTEDYEGKVETWTTVHEATRWSEAVTVYRKMVDGNWNWSR